MCVQCLVGAQAKVAMVNIESGATQMHTSQRNHLRNDVGYVCRAKLEQTSLSSVIEAVILEHWDERDNAFQLLLTIHITQNCFIAYNMN